MYYEEELAVHNSVMQFYQTIYNETKKLETHCGRVRLASIDELDK